MERSRGEEITLDLPWMRIAGKVWGPADGMRVLALHGWLDNAASFDRLAPLLPGIRLVAIDLPGHGLSDHRPPGMPYHHIDYVRDVHGVLEALQWPSVSLVGHSMGGGIACMFAGTFPDRVERLALIEALAPLTCQPEAAPSRLAEGIVRMQRLAVAQPKCHPARDAMAARLMQASPGLGSEAARILVERGTKEVPGGFTWRSDPRLRGPSIFRLSREQVYAFLDRVACPTLVVRAAQGLPFDLDEARNQMRHLPDARVVEVPGSHHVHLDEPVRVAEVIELFFASTRRDSR